MKTCSTNASTGCFCNKFLLFLQCLGELQRQDHNNHHNGKRKILVWSSHEAIYGPSKKANERNTSSPYDG